MAFIRNTVFVFSLSASLSFGSANNALLSLVPPGTKMVASIDLNAARSSPLGQYMLRQTNTDRDMTQFIAQTGVDPRRDLQSIVVACPGAPSGPTGQDCTLLIQGVFDPGKLRALVGQKASTASVNYGGVDVFVKTNSAGKSTAFATPDVGIALVGSLESVRQAIDSRANPTVLDSQLSAMISQVASKNDAWFASTVPGGLLGRQMAGTAVQKPFPKQSFDSVLGFDGGFALGDVVQFSLNAVTRSPQDATALSDVIRFGLGLLQTEAQNHSEAVAMANALQGMQINTTGDTVNMSASIPESTLEQMAQASQAKHPARSTKSTRQ